MSNVMVWDVKMFTLVDAFLGGVVCLVVVNSLYQCACCETYVHTDFCM